MSLRFHSSDAPKLWDLAARHCLDSEDVSTFAKAARATEKNIPIVLECGTRAQIEEIKSFFILHGIQPPTIEELRLD